MTRIAKPAGRAYHSQLRADQAEETRARILDAAAPVMARGLAAFSIPAVAREAGVSVPTVYRHFANKQDLIEAIFPHIIRRAAVNQPAPPSSIDDLRDGIRAHLVHLNSLDDETRAAMASRTSDPLRGATMPNRIAVFRALAETVEPKLANEDRDRVARLLVVLTQSASMRTLHAHLGLSVDEVADEIDWVVRAAIAAAQKGSGR